MCELDRIVVCSATPPQGFPASASFRPFQDGQCTTIGQVGPVHLSRTQDACPDKSSDTLAWLKQADINNTDQRATNVTNTGAGLRISMEWRGSTAVRELSFAAIRLVSKTPGSVLVQVPVAAQVNVNGRDIDAREPSIEFFFQSPAAADQATRYFQYHKCLKK